jgi:cytochrome b561
MEDIQDSVDLYIAAWRREMPHLRTDSLDLLARLLRAAFLLHQEALKISVAHGLPPGGLEVLTALLRNGAPYQLTPTHLYKSLLLTSGAITNRLHRLEALGLVERVPAPKDRRSIMVRLTERGKARCEEVLAVQAENADRRMSILSGEEKEQLQQILSRLIQTSDKRR